MQRCLHDVLQDETRDQKNGRGPFERPSPRCGGEGIRTPDPLNAIQVLSQLSYTPARDIILRSGGAVKHHLPLLMYCFDKPL